MPCLAFEFGSGFLKDLTHLWIEMGFRDIVVKAKKKLLLASVGISIPSHWLFPFASVLPMAVNHFHRLAKNYSKWLRPRPTPMRNWSIA